MALPVHAARPVGLGCAAAAGARRRDLGRPAAAAPAARQPQRLLLRARSHERRAAAGEAVRQEAHLGARDWRGRTAGAQSQSGSPRPTARRSVPRSKARPTGSPRRSTRRPACTTCRRWRSARLHADAVTVGAGQVLLQRLDEDRARRARRRRSCARSTSRPARSRGSCRRSVRRTPGAAR